MIFGKDTFQSRTESPGLRVSLAFAVHGTPDVQLSAVETPL